MGLLGRDSSRDGRCGGWESRAGIEARYGNWVARRSRRLAIEMEQTVENAFGLKGQQCSDVGGDRRGERQGEQQQ